MYAQVAVNILNRKLDRLFTYRLPPCAEEDFAPGTPVLIPFGKADRQIRGFIVALTETCDLPDSRIKELSGRDTRSADVEQQLISLAIWIRHRFGGTLYQCLSVVMPAKAKVKARCRRVYVFTGTAELLLERLKLAEKKKYYARKRLLEAFSARRELPGELVTDRLNISSATLKPLIAEGLIEVREEEELSGIPFRAGISPEPVLNPGQQAALSGILSTDRRTSLLFGITGSGKTEVYLRLIGKVLSEGREAVVLIPEIALTYQTVMRFYERFPGVVSVVHSRLSKGEKFERFEKARRGEIRIMIGPRSALFTPFTSLGLIIIDEFHENSYISEQVPRYHAVETAEKLAELSGAKVVLGSATPSVDAYEKALRGEYALFRLTERAVPGAGLPVVSVADMRGELRAGNRSVFSAELREKISGCLRRKEQVMLFLNRRGYSGSVSCRACGKPVQCPHCSIALNYHRDDTLHCHICGYTVPAVHSCPSCGSGLIGTFGIGTQKVEELLSREFPGIRTLRMDADTASGKDGPAEILEKFRNGEADALIGTQMIVKGHDFPNVTLVGILAADLSLNVPDYRSSERTFQLLTQAEGRAGRGGKPGECVVQTYHPEHYAVAAAVSQDYLSFYESEKIFRRQMKYPPFGAFAGVMVTGEDQLGVSEFIHELAELLRAEFSSDLTFLGPSEAPVLKVKDTFRYILYVKGASLPAVLAAKQRAEEFAAAGAERRKVYLSFYE